MDEHNYSAGYLPSMSMYTPYSNTDRFLSNDWKKKVLYMRIYGNLT